jgi:hypothetical protein
MKLRTVLTVSVLGVCLVLQSGCALFLVGAGAAAGAGGYAWYNGELSSVESGSIEKAWAASQAAMKDLEFTITEQGKDSLTAHLTARTARDKKVTVNLKKQTEKLTEIKIRVGTFGDEALSSQILAKIKAHL